MNRKLLFLLLFIAIVIILGYRLRDWDFDWSLFFSTLWSVHPGWLAASLVATFLTYVVRAFRWQVLLGPLKSINVGPLLSSTLVGFSAIYVLGRAGEVVRPVWLSRREQVSLTASVATIIVERFLDTLMIVVLFAWSLISIEFPATAGASVRIMKNTAWTMVAVSVGAIIFMFLFHSNIDRIVRYIPIRKVGELLEKFSQGLLFLKQRKRLALALVHSLLIWGMITLQFWFMMLGMNFQFSLQASTLVLVAAAIGSIAQIPGIGGGFQTGFAFCLTTFFAVPAEQAIAASLVAWAFSYVPTIAVAGLYMIIQGLSFKDLRTATVSE